MDPNTSLKGFTYRNIFLLLFLAVYTTRGRSPPLRYPADPLSGSDRRAKDEKQELYSIISGQSVRVSEQSGNPSLSKEELELIKDRVLDGLGLDSIPTRNLSTIPREEFDQAYKEYLNILEEEENEEIIDESEDEEPEDANFKSSYRFYSDRVTRPTKGRGRRSAGSWQKIVHFHVFIPSSSSPNTSSVVRATGRFWKKGSKTAGASGGTIPVSFYRLDNIPRGRAKKLGNLEEKFIATKNVSILGNEWIDVNLQDSVNVWMQNPDLDTGVLIKCDDCAATGVKFMTGGASGDFRSGGGRVPRLDVQTEIMGLRRIKRSRKMRKSLRKRGRHSDCRDENSSQKGRKSNKCCRRSMQVRFSDLPQFNFIISPREFDAYYCSGRCPARYNPANEHALLQSFLNLRGRRDIPSPCCAPTELKGLPILHIGKDGKLKTNYWSDVIVTKCECA